MEISKGSDSTHSELEKLIMAKNKTILVIGTEITVSNRGEKDYISLTDIARHRDAERSDYILQNWLRNRSTIEFIGLWEQLNNPNFNSIEFDGFKNHKNPQTNPTDRWNCVHEWRRIA